MIHIRSKTYPSLIISEEKIQVLLLDKTGKRASHLAEERLEPSVIVGGEVKDGKKLSQSLLKLFQEAKIDRHDVVVGIPENKCYTKILSLPRLRTDELGEAVEWEADTYLPVPADQVYMDWKIISEEKDVTKILLIAVPREIIDGYSTALEEAGLTPVAFETTALSLVRLIEKEERRILILELQREHAVLTLTKGKLIEASSIVSLVGEEEGEGLPYLNQTVQKMLSFYEAKHKDQEKVQTIYICGEGATQSAVTEIAKGSGREVKPCPISIENLPPGKELGFAVVSSLAMKEIEAPKDAYTINLLPPDIQEKFDRMKTQWVNKCLLTVTTAVTMVVTLSTLGALIYLGSLQASLESQKLNLEPLPEETGKVIKETEHLNRDAETIVKIGNNRTFPQARLAVILPNVPEGVMVVSVILDENQKKLRLVGRAQTRTNLLKFRDNLEVTEMYSQATLPLSSLEQSENIDFILNAKME